MPLKIVVSVPVKTPGSASSACRRSSCSVGDLAEDRFATCWPACRCRRRSACARRSEGDFRRCGLLGVDHDPVADLPRHPLQHPARGRDRLRLLADLGWLLTALIISEPIAPIRTTPIAAADEQLDQGDALLPAAPPQDASTGRASSDDLELALDRSGAPDAGRVDALTWKTCLPEPIASAAAASCSLASGDGRSCRGSWCPAVRSRRRSGRPAAVSRLRAGAEGDQRLRRDVGDRPVPPSCCLRRS